MIFGHVRKQEAITARPDMQISAEASFVASASDNACYQYYQLNVSPNSDIQNEYNIPAVHHLKYSVSKTYQSVPRLKLMYTTTTRREVLIYCSEGTGSTTNNKQFYWVITHLPISLGTKFQFRAKIQFINFFFNLH